MVMKKNKDEIFQRIRRKSGEKHNLRKIRRNRSRPLHFKRKKGLVAPRKFRRGNHICRNDFNDLYKNKKKDYYIEKHLPSNLKYLLTSKTSPFNLKRIIRKNYNTHGIIEIPRIFSIIEEPKDSYLIIYKIISALFLENNDVLVLDYKCCEKVELGSQVLLDIILKDFLIFTNKCQKIDRNHQNYFLSIIKGINIDNVDVRKMMFSVGSPVTLKIKEYCYSDIIRYKLCIHDNEKEKDYHRRMEQKEIDTTEMADYVIECLARMNKKLTPLKRDDLCTVIGEILINAEEHSTTKYRFSIGYFKEENIDGKHYGIFRLVILNFGKTIYEKFKDIDCPNKTIVKKMKNLSKLYTQKNLFLQRQFEEENLWTLYALQEEVTSVSPAEYKRGNGSIRFIDSFFSIKGSKDVDDVSCLTIQSGRTKIHFNGEYGIINKTNENNDVFKVMSFNDSGNIEDIPDSTYVYQTKEHFPGTIISAKLLLNDDDIEQITI